MNFNQHSYKIVGVFSYHVSIINKVNFKSKWEEMFHEKMILINVITVVVLLAIGIAGFYFWNKTTSYVTTDNAKVNGDQIKIASPASGQIKSLNVKQGDKLDKGDKVATVTVQGQDGETKDMDLKMPQKVQLPN